MKIHYEIIKQFRRFLRGGGGSPNPFLRKSPTPDCPCHDVAEDDTHLGEDDNDHGDDGGDTDPKQKT